MSQYCSISPSLNGNENKICVYNKYFLLYDSFISSAVTVNRTPLQSFKNQPLVISHFFFISVTSSISQNYILIMNMSIFLIIIFWWWRFWYDWIANRKIAFRWVTTNNVHIARWFISSNGASVLNNVIRICAITVKKHFGG